MKNGVNKAILVGRVGSDISHRDLGANTVAGFSFVVNEGETQTWFQVEAWNKRAEFARDYFRKGMALYLEGRIILKEWTGEDGKQQARLGLKLTGSQFLDSKGGGREAEDYGAEMSDFGDEDERQ